MASTTQQTPPPENAAESPTAGESLQSYGALDEEPREQPRAPQETQGQTSTSDDGPDKLADAQTPGTEAEAAPTASEMEEAAARMPAAAPAPASAPVAPSGTAAAESTDVPRDSRDSEPMLQQPLHHPMYHACAFHTAVAGQVEYMAAPPAGYPVNFGTATTALASWGMTQSWSTHYSPMAYANPNGNEQAVIPPVLEWSRQVSATVLEPGLGATTMLDPAAMPLDPSFDLATATGSSIQSIGAFRLYNVAVHTGAEYPSMPTNDAGGAGDVAALVSDTWTPVDLPQPTLLPGVQVWQNSRFTQIFFMTFPEA